MLVLLLKFSEEYLTEEGHIFSSEYGKIETILFYCPRGALNIKASIIYKIEREAIIIADSLDGWVMRCGELFMR